jgi:hypothetical protein
MNAVTRTWLPVLLGVATFASAWWMLRVPVNERGLQVVFEVRTTYTDVFTLFWDDHSFSYEPARMQEVPVSPDAGVQRITFELPASVHHVQGMRLDPGGSQVDMDLKAIVLRGPYREVHLDPAEIVEHFGAMNDLKPLAVDSIEQVVPLLITGNDPYLASTLDLAPLVAEAMDPVRPVLRSFLLALLIGALAWLLLRALLRARHRPEDAVLSGHAAPIAMRNVWLPLATGVLVFALTHGFTNNISFEDRALRVEFELVATHKDNFQVFYADRPGAFTPGNYVNTAVNGSNGPQLVSFRMPQDTLFSFLRFDPGNVQDSLVIRRMWLRCNDESSEHDARSVFALFKPNEQVDRYEVVDDALVIHFSGNDPFLFCDTDLRSEVKELWTRSGNGPMPLLFGLVAGLFAFFTLLFRPAHAAGTLKGSPSEFALAGIFLALLSLPLLSEVMPVEPKLADTEKRPMAEKPLLKLHSLTTFAPRYTKFYTDHFGFRKSLFRMNGFFHSYVLRDSPMPDNLIFGKDGFMFLIRPGAVDQYRGIPVFTEQELLWIGERLEKRRQWLAERGTDYYLMFPPLTASIYPDKLPDNINKIRERGGLDQLIDHLRAHTKIPVVDCREALKEGRKVRDVYYTTDIHWNPWGGYIGYRELMATLLKDHPELGSACLPEDYIVQADTNDQGDLAMQMAMNDRFKRVTYMMVPLAADRARYLPEEPLPASAFFKYKPVFKMGPDPNAPKLLMFRDSFAVYLMPYLSEHFSRSVYVWTPIFIHDIVEKEDPDIVVQEVLEIFIRDLLEDKLRDDI